MILPFPAKILWPNGRGHHMAKHREFQKHKQWAYHAALSDGARAWTGVSAKLRLAITIHPKTAHAIDADNCVSAMKAYQDGVAAAMGIDDKAFGVPRIIFAEPIKGGRVTIELEAI